ncbi:glycosyltransferase family 4 protein [Pedococcus bigeumensis]|uniref:glycosyltransferase family 4 protein n=1 Tax=Pedococcus bigeumensis TaxID=433644 RepID=UPI0031DFDC11
MHSHFQLPTGGTKYIFEVTRRLAMHRQVEVVVESASPLWRERYADAGVRLTEIGGLTSTSLAYWGSFPYFLRRDLTSVRQRAAGRPVIVSSFFPMPWIAGRVAREHGLRHVSLCFEPFPFFHDEEVIGLYPKWKQHLLLGLRTAYGRLDAQGVASADSLVTLNASTMGQIARVYGLDSVPAYAGVDTSLFRPYSQAETADLRERFGDGPLVVHSTDFSPIKRTDLAIRAFARAAADVPTAVLVVTSTRQDGAAEADLMRLAQHLGVQDRVVYTGFLPFADLPRLYSLASVLLQTGTSAGSGATTMSLPVKEAMACGTAVVRSGATDEDVEDGVSGFLVDPRDVQETGARLADVLLDPPRAERMGMAGKDRVVRTYSWDRVVDVITGEVDA